jgi:hypothetical protein
MILDPDSLRFVPGEALRERQIQTGEMGDGKIVDCRPDLNDPGVVQQSSRALCLATPYAACLSCRHHRFELIFEQPQDDWVLCPRWEGEQGTGPPDFYVPVSLTECGAKTQQFCPQCPCREELAEAGTDKKKEGWLERYRKLTRDL